jgi:hypothetical protein
MLFDTAAFDIIHIDPSFIRAHRSLLSDSVSTVRLSGSAWDKYYIPAYYYNGRMLNVALNDVTLSYPYIGVFGWRETLANFDNEFDGTFGIPTSDTTHIWELNFEHNYLELHDADSFNYPKDCTIYPMEMPHLGYIKIPMTIISENDTLYTENSYPLDSGAAHDISVAPPAKEIELLAKRNDGIWLDSRGGYVRSYTTNIIMDSGLELQDVSIYTLENRNDLPNDYIIGLNFLKRFNVLFDMKNHQVGLQPISEYRRLIKPFYPHYFFRVKTVRGDQRKYVIAHIADYPKNYFKTAGLQEGDEIVSINGLRYEDVRYMWHNQFPSPTDTLRVKVIRNNKPMTIIVPIELKDMVGDY